MVGLSCVCYHRATLLLLAIVFAGFSRINETLGETSGVDCSSVGSLMAFNEMRLFVEILVGLV